MIASPGRGRFSSSVVALDEHPRVGPRRARRARRVPTGRPLSVVQVMGRPAASAPRASAAHQLLVAQPVARRQEADRVVQGLGVAMSRASKSR